MNGPPFLRYVAGLIAGIVLYVLLPDGFWLLVGTWIVGLGLYLWGFGRIRKSRIKPIQTLPGVGILLILIGLGWAITFQHTASNRPSTISQLNDSLQAYVGVVSAQPEERAKTYRVELEIRKGKWAGHSTNKHENQLADSAGVWHALSGRVIIYLDKAGQPLPAYGEVWVVSGPPRTIDPPLNPGEFNYKRYLSYRNIGHQQYLRPFQRQILSVDPPNPVMQLATRVNRWADSVLTHQIKTRPEFGVVNAMILGVRDDLDTEQYQAYSAAGAVHILSVSGLHVGILFQVLTFLLGFLAKRKGGKLLMAAFQLTILWFYALVTGFSPPVLRSAGMFTMVILANALGRQQQLPNTVAASAFFILCFDPYALFSAGFQLSYLAVAGIGAWHSPLYQSITFPNKWANKLWELTAVALVAQLITFPLGVFYFHQFPTYFLLANPVVIVLSEILLPMAMLCLALSWVPFVNSMLGWLLQKIAFILNGAVQLTSELPGAAWDGLWLSPAAMVLTYVLILCGASLWLTRNRAYIWAICIVSMGLAGVLLIEIEEQAHQEKLAVHFLPHHTAISLTSGRQSTLLTDLDSADSRSYDFYLKNTFGQWGVLTTKTAYLNRNGSTNGSMVSIPGVHQSGAWTLWVWHGKTILLVNRLASQSYWRLPAVVDYLIIRRNALQEWSQLDGRVVARHIILDDSNRTPLTDKLVVEARQRGIACFSVRQQGAYIADLEE